MSEQKNQSDYQAPANPLSSKDEAGSESAGGEVELPATLTLERCSCGSEVCNRFGFAEGMFYQGSGFDEPLAQEVKRRYDSHPILVEDIRVRDVVLDDLASALNVKKGDAIGLVAAASELSRLRARVAELEGALERIKLQGSPLRSQGGQS